MRDHTRRQRWLGASLAVIVLAASAQPALAQDDVSDAARAVGNAAEAAAQDDEGLTVIYVTPNRREENIQDVAVSVATLP